jgi:hypothetical protein
MWISRGVYRGGVDGRGSLIEPKPEPAIIPAIDLSEPISATA